MRIFSDLRFYLLCFILLLVATVNNSDAQTPITNSFFGTHIAGPSEVSYKRPTSSPTVFRLLDGFACNPRVCNSGNGYSYADKGNYITWESIEYSPGVYDFYVIDKIIDSIYALYATYGAGTPTIVYTMRSTPQFYSSNSGAANYAAYGPTDTAKVSQFVRALALHAKNRNKPITHFESVNEPEAGSVNWVDTWPNLYKYSKALYQTIKSIDTSWKVLSPCTQGSGADYWMGQFLSSNADAKNTFDIVALHGYINFYSGSTQEKFETLYSKMQTLMATYGISGKDLWDDEAFDNFYVPSGTIATQNTALWDAQSAYLAQRFLIGAAKGLSKVFWYAYDQNNGKQWYNNVSTYTLNAVGTAEATVRSWLVGATVSNLTVTSGVYTVDITKAGVTKKAVWTYSGTASYATAFGQYEDLAGTTTAISGGTVTIGRKPVLLKQPVNVTIYVSKTGSNSNTGTKASPVLTLARAAQLATKPGDSIMLKAGDVYPEYNYLTTTGVVVAAYGTGAAPTFSGWQQITTWTNKGGGVYSYKSTALPTYINVLNINGTFYEKSRYPKTGYLTITSHTGTSSGTVTVAGLSSEISLVGSELVSRKTRWVMDKARVVSHTSGTIGFAPLNGESLSYETRDGYGCFFQNIPTSLFDTFGQWRYDSATKELLVYFGTAAPTGYTVKIPKLAQALNNAGSGNSFVGINFEGYNGVAIYLNAPITLKNCTFGFNGEYAVYGQDISNVTITGCTFADHPNNAITLLQLSGGSNNATVYGNTLNRTGAWPGMGGSNDSKYYGILVQGANFTIRRNTVLNSGYTAIYAKGPGTVDSNYVDRFCFVKDDGGGIYSFNGSNTVSPQPLYINKNLVLNGVGVQAGVSASDIAAEGVQTKAHGIYLDEYVNNTVVQGNTLANATGDNSGLFLHNTFNNLVDGNTFYNNGFGLRVRSFNTGSTATHDVTVTNNLFLADSAQTLVMVDAAGSSLPFGTINNNKYWARSTTGTPFRTKVNNATTTALGFSSWKTALAGDASSVLDSFTEASLPYSLAGGTLPLTGTWKDASGTQYATSIALPVLGSKLLLRVADTGTTDTPPPGQILIVTPDGKYWRYSDMWIELKKSN